MNKFKCPHCGQTVFYKLMPYVAEKRGWGMMTDYRSSAEFMEMESTRPLQNAIAVPQPKPTGYHGNMPADSARGFVKAERFAVDHLPTRESNVDVPWLQALRSGALIALLSAPVAFGICWHFAEMDFWDSLIVTTFVGWLAFFGTAARMWFRQSNWYDEILQRTETFVRQDLNNDGVVGPGGVEEAVPVEVRGGSGKSMYMAELPGPRDRLIWFAWLVLNPKYRVTFSFNGARDAKYGDTSFRRLRDIFLNRGWAIEIGESGSTAGVELTTLGRKVLYRLSLETGRELPENVTGSTVILAGGQDVLSERYEWIEP